MVQMRFVDSETSGAPNGHYKDRLLGWVIAYAVLEMVAESLASSLLAKASYETWSLKLSEEHGPRVL
jgi:hypothetical protein